MRILPIRQKPVLPESVKEKLHSLLKRMNHETKYASNGNSFNSEILMGLRLEDKFSPNKARLIDQRYIVAPVFRPVVGTSKIEFNGKEYLIENETGLIKPLKTGFFESVKQSLKNIEKAVNIFAENFSNKDVVKKDILKMSGFTEEGLNKLFGAVNTNK